MKEQSKYFKNVISEMEQRILEDLKDVEIGYGTRKWAISERTGIPIDILTVLLKRLKYQQKVELIMIWSEHTGMPNGSGYCLAHINKAKQ